MRTIQIEWSKISSLPRILDLLKFKKYTLYKVLINKAMAATDLDETTNCPVCYEGYEETGEHIPRILPCHHSVCEKCITELLRGYTFTCPECRKKHHALKDSKSFPQNKYILSLLKKTLEGARRGNFDICEGHDREISLFCNEVGCKKAVCSLCLISDHKNHDIKDLQEINTGKSQNITKNVKSLMQSLDPRKRDIPDHERRVG